MSTPLLDLRMHDGSRHFGDFPECVEPVPSGWHALRDHAAALEGATVTGFVTDEVTEVWLHFRFRDHDFAVNNQHGDWWFFVDDPACPEEILSGVLDHFARHFSVAAIHARAGGSVAPGEFRVVVLEATREPTRRDFATLPEARSYADDAASESDDRPPLAYVYDDRFQLTYEGKHYATK